MSELILLMRIACLQIGGVLTNVNALANSIYDNSCYAVNIILLTPFLYSKMDDRDPLLSQTAAVGLDTDAASTSMDHTDMTDHSYFLSIVSMNLGSRHILRTNYLFRAGCIASNTP